jgi:hypothetical protein
MALRFVEGIKALKGIRIKAKIPLEEQALVAGT